MILRLVDQGGFRDGQEWEVGDWPLPEYIFIPFDAPVFRVRDFADDLGWEHVVKARLEHSIWAFSHFADEGIAAYTWIYNTYTGRNRNP